MIFGLTLTLLCTLIAYWRPVRSFDATAHFLTIAKHYDIAICKDRTNEHCEGLKKQYGLPHSYMNAGFFLTNKEGMAKVSKVFFERYNHLPKNGRSMRS